MQHYEAMTRLFKSEKGFSGNPTYLGFGAMPNEARLLGLDAIIQVFNQDKGLLVVDLTKHLAEQAREVIWKYSFEKHKEDAVHLATAVYINQFHSIDEFHTFDHDLLKFNGRPEIPIPIIEPTFELYPAKPASLFDVLGEPEQ
jgi:hypothetical protein